VRPGTQLANIGNMPDVQQSPVPTNPPESTPDTMAKNKKGWLAVVLVLALGAVGIVVWLVSEPSYSTGESVAESTLPLETFIVNLSGPGQRAYLRAGITLGLAHPLSANNQAEAAPIALVRDTILSVLATAQPQDLLQTDGKRQLKEALLKALQEHVPQIAVQNVYFTEFLVQM